MSAVSDTSELWSGTEVSLACFATRSRGRIECVTVCLLEGVHLGSSSARNLQKAG